MTAIFDNSFAKVQYLTIDADRHGQRIDNFLLFLLKGVPKSYVYRVLRKGEVRVNKKRIKASYRLQRNDVLRIPPVRVSKRQYDALKIGTSLKSLVKSLCQDIVYQNADFIVLNKPAGLAVHSGTHMPFGVVELLKAEYSLEDIPESQGFYSTKAQLELVHRLDQGTSGCLLVAKNRRSLLNLQAVVKARKVEKCYVCLLYGRVNDDDFTVDAALMSDVEMSGEKMVVVDHQQGKASVSKFRVLRRFSDCTLVKVNLVTGRKHQIRVHARYIGHPILGDTKYGDKIANATFTSKGLKRLFLHAESLSWLVEGKRLLVTAELPDSLADVLKALT